jgi:hypothetical protein
VLIYQRCDDLGIVSNTLVINQTENEIKIINKIYKLDNEDKTYRASLSKRKFIWLSVRGFSAKFARVIAVFDPDSRFYI